MLLSVIIPTFNGAARIGECLDALLQQSTCKPFEIIVVDDGSTDETAAVVRKYPNVSLLTQSNSGPAEARNHGVREARGSIVLFTDDDCVPEEGWIEAMTRPFEDPAVVGTKGTYRTGQRALAARFVQAEYEDRYRRIARFSSIDFVDTYSAAFIRLRFLEMGGYDSSFPVACAEDIELSYRMSTRGWLMKFAPDAVVHHTHPDTASLYLRKKYKFAFWRVLAVSKNPAKAIQDSHTPQLMKLQILLLPAMVLAVAFDFVFKPSAPASLFVLAAFVLSTLPFALRSIINDPILGLSSPVFLAARSCAQLMGLFAGCINLFLSGNDVPAARGRSHNPY